MRAGCRFALIFLLLTPGIRAQQRAPFVGCPSGGQAGPVDPPTGEGPIVKDAAAAKNLAFYKAAMAFGVLAPRGWHCFEVYGSSGDALLIAPWRIDQPTAFQLAENPRTGPFIVVSLDYGDTSGRFMVAELIKRVFPAFRKIASEVYTLFPELEDPNSSGPYPADTLTYRGDRLVEFRTPAETKGLGTQVWLKEDENPIEGMVLLLPEHDVADSVVLSVRLPANLRHLAPTIIHQVELDASAPPKN